MTSNGSANEAPRGTRAKELNNAETGGRNDIMTIILANGASYDFKECVVHRRLWVRLLSRYARLVHRKSLAIGYLFIVGAGIFIGIYRIFQHDKAMCLKITGRSPVCQKTVV